MLEIPENVRQVLVKLIPASVLNNVCCFVFYDNHPADEKNIDVTICTTLGEVKEYYKRDLVSSIKLPSMLVSTEVKIIRNSNCALFYLVAAEGEICLLSRKDKLKVHQRISSVERYDISDITCSGKACLRIFCKGDAVPLIFDDNFDNFKRPDISQTFTEAESDDTLPIITHLMRKLTEAKYSVKCNEKVYKDLLDLHQNVAFSTYKEIHPNLDDSVFKDGAKKMANALKINTQSPWIKVCNKKIVIVINVCNMNHELLEDVHLVIHGTTEQSVQYTTKIFENTNKLLLWEQSRTQTLKYNVNSAIVVVINLKELKNCVVSKIEFNGVLFYRKMGKDCLLPIEDVKLSSLDTMGEEFDVISSEPMDSNIILTILATTAKTDLILRHIKSQNDQLTEQLTLGVFCKYLKMERVTNFSKVAIHRKSPYHVLNGVMIVMHNDSINGNGIIVSVFSRTPSQVVALIHYIHDAIPLTIVITTPSYKITAKDDKLSKYNEDITEETQLVQNYETYASSILNRTKLILKYLDHSMVKMSESKNSMVQSKIGSEIDLFAGGEKKYLEFKNGMREEAARGVKSLNSDVQHNSEPDIMCID